MKTSQEKLLKTKVFLDSYLSKKNKEIEQEAYLSLYLSHDSRGDREARLRKMIKEAELSIRSQLHHREAEQMMAQLRNINTRELINPEMSLAIFVTTQFSGYLFIPFSVVESVIVARSLHLKPILNWINREDQFYLVTLSAKLCRLLRGDAFSIKEVARVAVTENTETKTFDKKEREKLIGEAEEKFYSIVKDDHFPIILGGVQNNNDLFKKMNRDPDLIKERIAGNLDRMSYRDLHQKCLKLLEEKRSTEGMEVLKRFKEESPYGKVLTDLKQITIAAVQGRVQNLVIPNDKFIWGKLDKESGTIVSTSLKNLAVPEDDVFDDLAEIVISRGGDVTMCKHRELPSGIEAMAFLKAV
jgi:hypothetical protein